MIVTTGSHWRGVSPNPRWPVAFKRGNAGADTGAGRAPRGDEADFGRCFHKTRNIQGSQQTLSRGRETGVSSPPGPQKEPTQTQPSSPGHGERELAVTGPAQRTEVWVMSAPGHWWMEALPTPPEPGMYVFTDFPPAPTQG